MNLLCIWDIVQIVDVIGTFCPGPILFERKYSMSPNAMVIFDCVLIACQYYFSSIKHVISQKVYCPTIRMWNMSKNQRFVAKALNQKNVSDCLASKINIM